MLLARFRTYAGPTALNGKPGYPDVVWIYHLYDPIPWSPLDDPEPEGLSDIKLKHWRARRLHELGLGTVDFATGESMSALWWPVNGSGGHVIFQRHRCES